MTRTKILLVLPACVLAGALASCGTKPEAKPAEPKTGGTAAPQPPAPPATAKAVRLDKYKLGAAMGPAGEATQEGSTFGKGDKAFVSFAIVDAKPKSQARVVWVAKAGAKVGEESKPLPENEGVVSFAADTKAWAVGDYSLQVYVVEPETEPRQLGGSDFKVTAPRSK